MREKTKVAIDNLIWEANDYARIKQEHGELLEALSWIVNQVDKFGGITIENNHSAFEKFRAIIAKVEK